MIDSHFATFILDNWVGAFSNHKRAAMSLTEFCVQVFKFFNDQLTY